jgi:hypothetical protein
MFVNFRYLYAVFGLILALLIGVAPAQAEWRRAESPNFVLYGTISEGRLRERILQLEDFDRLMRLITNVSEPPAPNKLHIYIVDGPSDLRTVHAMPAGFTGVYIATANGIAAIVDGRTDAGNDILFHEYAHHFMRQYAANAYPAWYVEGFAEYFSTVRFTPRKIDIGNFSPGRAYSLTDGSWLPTEQILHGNPQSMNGPAAEAFYAQSWLVTHWFFSTHERQDALRRYLVAARNGDPRDALQTATGLDVTAFTAELRRHIRGNQISYRQMNRPEGWTPAAVTVTTLPASADGLMLYAAALRIGIDEGKGPEYLQQIRGAAARHASDPFAQRILAHAELLYGDSAVADRLLDGLLQASPADAELMYLKGMRYLTASEREDASDEARAADSRLARDWFTRAHRADGDNYQTLFRFAQSLRGEDEYVSENTANVMMLAHQLAPQVAEITMNAAALLMNRGEYADAIALARPLSADPHNASLARAARQMIEHAQTRGAGVRPSPARPASADNAPEDSRPAS